MKRRALAICASLLLAGLVPGMALANPPSNLDQHNNVGSGNGNRWGGTYAQTVTAGKTGMLSGFDLNLQGPGTVTAYIYSVDGSGKPTGSPVETTSAGAPVSQAWVHYSLPLPLPVTPGLKFGIAFDLGGSGIFAFTSNETSDTYPAGNAYELVSGVWQTPAFMTVGRFAFRTYVDTVGTVLQWDKPQITAGVSTPLTLTATMTFANGAEAGNYLAGQIGLLPTWFSVTHITCSDTAGKIVQSDCTVANFLNEFGPNLIPANIGGDVLTFTLTGTAHPASSTAGTTGSATGRGCVAYPPPTFPQVQPAAAPDPTTCTDGSATVQVVAVLAAPSPTQAPTPPPTSTGVAPASDAGSSAWLLPLGLIALIASLGFIAFRRRRIAQP